MNNTNDILYYSKQWNFSFSYPKDWQIIYENEPAGSWIIPITIASPKHDNVIASFMVNARDGEILQQGNVYVPGNFGMIKMPSTPLEYIEMEKKSLASQFPNFTYLKGTIIDIDNKKAAYQTYKYQGQFCFVTEESITIFSKGQTFQIIMEIPSTLYNLYYSSLKNILNTFKFGNPANDNQKSNDKEVNQELTAEEKYNNAVSLYKQAKYKEAKEAFSACVKENIYKLQSAYACALCIEEMGKEPVIEGLTEEDEKNSPKVYLSSNIAATIIEKGYPAALPKNGEVKANIDGKEYIISIVSGFGFGGFFKNAWRKQDNETIPIADPSKNPYPSWHDNFIIDIVKSSRVVLPTYIPKQGLKTDISSVIIEKVKEEPKPLKTIIKNDVQVKKDIPVKKEIPIKEESTKKDEIGLRISGWLYLPLIILIIQFLKIFSVLYELTNINSPNLFIYWPSLIINFYILIFASYLLYFFLKRKNVAPMLFNIFFLSISEFWCIALMYFPAYKFAPKGQMYFGIEPAALPFSISLIWSFILISCFLNSKRANKTFVEKVEKNKFPENTIYNFTPKLLNLENKLKKKGLWNLLIIPLIQASLVIITLISGTTISWLYDTFLHNLEKNKKITYSKPLEEKPISNTNEVSNNSFSQSEYKKEPLQSNENLLTPSEKEIPITPNNEINQAVDTSLSHENAIKNSFPLQSEITWSYTKGKDAEGFASPIPNKIRNIITISNTTENNINIYPDMFVGEIFQNKAIANAITSAFNKDNRLETAPFQVDVFPSDLSCEYSKIIILPSKDNDENNTVLTHYGNAELKLNENLELFEKKSIYINDTLSLSFEVLNSSTFADKTLPDFSFFTLGPVIEKTDIDVSDKFFVLFGKALTNNNYDFNIISSSNTTWVPLNLNEIKKYYNNFNEPDDIKIQLLLLFYTYSKFSNDLNDFILSIINDNNASFLMQNCAVKILLKQNNQEELNKLLEIAKDDSTNINLRLNIISNLYLTNLPFDHNFLLSIASKENEDIKIRNEAFTIMCKIGKDNWLNIYKLISNDSYFKFNSFSLLSPFKKELEKNSDDISKEKEFFLAYLYENGIFFEKDINKALPLYINVLNKIPLLNSDEQNIWYSLLGEKASKDVQWDIGTQYENQNNINEAFKWFHLAANNGHSAAQCKIGWWYYDNTIPQNPENAVKWTKKAHDQGNANAINNLGVFYENAFGVDKDYKKSYDCYIKAAEKGNIYAQCNLGLVYEYGKDVEKDYVKAFEWYKKSAENGNGRGMIRLGLLYENGNGVTKNLEEAVKWYRNSANTNNPDGQFNLATMFENGLGIYKNESEAFNYYEKAAMQGHSEAQRNLGRLYKNGIGTIQNYEKAIYWYKKAVEQNNKIAICNLEPVPKSIYFKF